MKEDLQLFLKTKSILYVEDDTISVDAIMDYLDLLFSKVYFAENGMQAYDVYEKNSPDIILTDIDMPELNGIDLIKKIRKKNRDVHIIILSAYTDTEYFIEAVELGLVKYIVKPFVGEKFLQALEKIMNEQPKQFFIGENCNYDYEKKVVTYDDKEYKLTKKEISLMELLIQRKEKLVSFDEIESIVWSDYNDMMTSETLRTLVKKLRQKLPKDKLKNLAGMGYKLIA